MSEEDYFEGRPLNYQHSASQVREHIGKMKRWRGQRNLAVEDKHLIDCSIEMLTELHARLRMEKTEEEKAS